MMLVQRDLWSDFQQVVKICNWLSDKTKQSTALPERSYASVTELNNGSEFAKNQKLGLISWCSICKAIETVILASSHSHDCYNQLGFTNFLWVTHFALIWKVD